MKKVKYYRDGRKIIDMETGQVSAFKYIAEAKRESRKIQMDADGALGRGTVQLKR